MNQNNPVPGQPPATHFASPERATDAQLREQIRFVVDNPVMHSLLSVVPGVLAILNENRQVIGVNDTFLALLGVSNPDQILGLRPGEAIHCIHSHEEPGGCGTARHCITCGAAIAIVTSLETNAPQQRYCAATVARNGHTEELFFDVRSQPIQFGGQRFLLLVLRDNSADQQRATLERTFFHDLNNMVFALVGSTELLRLQHDTPAITERTDQIRQIAWRIAREIDMQRALNRTDQLVYKLTADEIAVATLLNDVSATFAQHPSADEIRLEIDPVPGDPHLRCDIALMHRILGNMVLNALEATTSPGVVRIGARIETNNLVLWVWNAGEIPAATGLRIFQRNFSTKASIGRGIGTFAMKLFGEKYMGGQVTFTSDAHEGTTFSLRLPRSAGPTSWR